MLELKNISFNAENESGEKEILKNINLKIDNSFVVITGPNGGGKSTLAKIIAGILTPVSGQILLDGEDITHMSVTERANKGILKMLSLPVNTAKLCLAKFTVLILLSFVQMVMTIAAYFISAAIASALQDYNFVLEPLYVCRVAFSLYAGAVPMAAVFWMIANLIQTPVFLVGIGLASIVPSVLMINTKIWFAYPMSYPFYLLMIEYGRSAAGVYENQIAWLPWLPAAVSITVIALGIACMRFGAAERR